MVRAGLVLFAVVLVATFLIRDVRVGLGLSDMVYEVKGRYVEVYERNFLGDDYYASCFVPDQIDDQDKIDTCKNRLSL